MSEVEKKESTNPPPTSISPTCTLSIMGMPEDAPWSEAFQKVTQQLIVNCGRFMDLSHLDGVTLGFDYDDALASVDLGYESKIAKGYTNSDGLIGVGKMLRVRRDDAMKVHVVLNANVLMDLVDHELESDDFWSAANFLAHELAHVEVNTWFETHSPGVMMAAHQGDWAVAAIRDAAHTIWEEYAACRLSAPFSQGTMTTLSYVQSFETSLSGTVPRARESIKLYRSHSDRSRLLIDTSRIVALPLKMAAYLMGHLDGLEEELDLVSRCPMTSESGLEKHFDSLQGELRAAWETRKAWDGLAGVDGIVDVVLDALETVGVELSLNQEPPGSTVCAPFTAESMPNGEADMEIIRIRQILG
ncbi:hypothetical protein ACI7YU_18665 [Pseudomonas siliginis]|uniref:hypothetical protein n=1 Tax=Pseudomonas siliginis TaxID=2842346 RepID=UPI00387090F4